MNKLIEQWNSFWFRSGPPHALALFRIAFGLYLLVEALTYLPFTAEMFSREALTFSLWAPHAPSSITFLLVPPSVFIAWVIALLYVLACIGLTLGTCMRLSIAVLLILFAYYWQLSFHFFSSSYHRIYFLTLAVMLLSGADKTFSLRMLRTHGSVYAWEPISVFFQRLLAVQISFTYLGVGLQKSWLPAWKDGNALIFSLIGRWSTPLGQWIIGLGLPFWAWSLGVELVKISEFFIPFGLWMKRWRWWCVGAGVLFHGGIAILMGIWWFLALIPAYILFWQPEEVHMYCKRRSNGQIR